MGCERRGLVLGAARLPHRPLPSLAPCLCLFLLQLLELPFPLQLLTVPMLSSQPFSWGLRLQEPGQGVHIDALGAPIFTIKTTIPYRLGFSPQPQKNILVSHSRSNPAPWKHLIYTNPAQRFLPDRLQNTPKIPVFQSRTPKTNRYFSCAQSPRFAR